MGIIDRDGNGEDHGVQKEVVLDLSFGAILASLSFKSPDRDAGHLLSKPEVGLDFPKRTAAAAHICEKYKSFWIPPRKLWTSY